MVRYLTDNLQGGQEPLLPVLSGEAGPYNKLVVAYGSMVARFFMAERISEQRKLHNQNALTTSVLEVIGRLMIRETKSMTEVQSAQSTFDQLLKNRPLQTDRITRMLDNYKTKMSTLAPNSINELDNEGKFMYWESYPSKETAHLGSLEFRAAMLHCIPRSAFSEACRATYDHLVADDDGVTTDMIDALELVDTDWPNIWSSATPNARIGMLEGVVRSNPDPSMKSFVTSVFCVMTVLCKGSNYTDQWVNKMTERINGSSHITLPNQIDANFLKSIAASLGRDSLDTSTVRKSLQVLYLAVQDPIYRPIAWAVEQARFSNITTALALAECFAKVRFFPIDALVDYGLPQTQFTAFAQVALDVLYDPFMSIVAAGDATRSYADIGYVADTLKSALLNDDTFKRGYQGDLVKSVALPIGTLKTVVDCIVSLNRQILSNVFTLDQILSTRTGGKLFIVDDKYYLNLGPRVDLDARPSTISTVTLRDQDYRVQDTRILTEAEATRLHLPQDDKIIPVTAVDIMDIVTKEEPSWFTDVRTIAKALHAQTEQRKLSTILGPNKFTPSWLEDLGDDVIAAAMSLKLKLPKKRSDESDIVTNMPDNLKYQWYIPGRVPADSNETTKQVYPWGYPPTDGIDQDDDEESGGSDEDTGEGETLKSPPSTPTNPQVVQPQGPSTSIGTAGRVPGAPKVPKPKPVSDKATKKPIQTKIPQEDPVTDIPKPTILSSIKGVTLTVSKSNEISTLALHGQPTKPLTPEDIHTLFEPLIRVVQTKGSSKEQIAIISRCIEAISKNSSTDGIHPSTRLALQDEPPNYIIPLFLSEDERAGMWGFMPDISPYWAANMASTLIIGTNSEKFLWSGCEVVLRDDISFEDYLRGHQMLTLAEMHSRQSIISQSKTPKSRESLLRLHINSIGRLPEYVYQCFPGDIPTNKSRFVSFNTVLMLEEVVDVDYRFWLSLPDEVINIIMTPADRDEQLAAAKGVQILLRMAETFDSTVVTWAPSQVEKIG